MDTFNSITSQIDKIFEGKPAWKIVLISTSSTVLLFCVKDLIDGNESVYTRVKKKWFKILRSLPYVQDKIDGELEKLSSSMLKEMNESINNEPYLQELPVKGLNKKEVIDKTIVYSNYGNFKWEEGYASGTVYNANEELTNLMTEIYGLSIWTNPLHVDVFPGVRKMEAEVVRMCCSMFKGSEDSCGVMTTGGTESIVLALKAYRDYGSKMKNINKPEIIVPVTAHAAFDKGAQLLGLTIKHAPIDPVTYKVEVKAVEKMITGNTCMIAGSAPQFPHGVIDSIEALGKLCVKYDVPLHVDACLGGFLIPFAADAGFSLPPFDFSVPGVTSISCDTHKYGYTPKGSSVLMYSEKKFRHCQYFLVPDWPGGIYATPTISGSRTGAIIAASWAALLYYGKEGYVECTRKVLETRRKIEQECRKIAGLSVMGKPEVSVVAIKSDVFNIYALSDAMTKKGWNLNALQFPSCIHIAVTLLHTKQGVAEKFVNDLKMIAENLVKNPPTNIGESAAFYGMAQSLPDRTVVEDAAKCYLDSCYSTSRVEH